MKKKLFIVAAICVALFSLTGCDKDPEVIVNESDLVGKWVKSGTLEYWRFDSSRQGETWDEADSVFAGDDGAIRFDWSLSDNEVTCLMRGQMGEVVPKVYTITAISSSAFTWENDYGITTTFDKQI